MRVRRRRLRKLLLLSALAVSSLVAAGMGFAYSYITDSETLAALIRREAPRYIAGARLTVDRVMLKPMVGDVVLKQLALTQRVDGVETPLLRIAWVQVRHSFRSLLRGRFEPSEVLIAQPTLRLARRRDGSWNVQGLLASPFPKANSPMPIPRLRIQGGKVQFVDERGDPKGVLSDVAARVEPTPEGLLRIEGTARGDTIERLDIEGTLDPRTGRLELSRGTLAELTLSEGLLKKLPPEARPLAAQVGLLAGVVDASISKLVYDPAASPTLTYAATLGLRSGTWACPKLPFPLSEVSADATVADGLVTLLRAEGRYGRTRAVASGALDLAGPASMSLEITDLEVDERLKARTPPQFLKLWEEFKPSGRVNLALKLARPGPGAPVGFGVSVFCEDVAMTFHLFPYPLEHVRGTLRWEGKRITVEDMSTTVGGGTLMGWGTIDDPGPLADIRLHFAAKALPVDDKLRQALPPEVRKVLDQFHPRGSVRGTADVRRTPPKQPGGDPRKDVKIDVALDLNPGCSMVWDGLKYPVEDLEGHLEVHPDRWTFQRMKGSNGLAKIAADGEVRMVDNRPELDLSLRAERLSFDDQLRLALPAEWRATWSTLNPRGSSKVDATIATRPGRRDHYRLVVVPEPETAIQLVLTPAPRAPGGPKLVPLRLPTMRDLRGRFVYDDGKVDMLGVDLTFHGASVRVETGAVEFGGDGKFALRLGDVAVKKLRLDAELQQVMPPEMAGFARRLDDKPFQFGGNLGVAWSGKSGEPAVCDWDHARVTFLDNTIQAGLALEHIQGEAIDISGRSDGRAIEVHGRVALASVVIDGQQITELSAPIDVAGGLVRLDDIRGQILGGTLAGKVRSTIDATPKYNASLNLQGVDLEQYARTVPGRQPLKGKLSGKVALSGVGYDLHTIQGEGDAEVVAGDLGTLPAYIRLLKVLRFSPATKTAFDSARVAFTLQNGEATLDPIKLTGDALSLRGKGTVDLQGDVDLTLNPLAGRDERLHVRGVSDASRTLLGQLAVIHVKGPAGSPSIKPVALPGAARPLGEMVKGLGRRGREAEKAERR